jgi:AbrB family looped-hinge helix DNA binding protein
MSDVVTLSSNFQIPTPKKVRESQNWKRGQQFAFIPKDGGYLLVPVPKIEDLRGIAKGANIGNYRDREDRY